MRNLNCYGRIILSLLIGFTLCAPVFAAKVDDELGAKEAAYGKEAAAQIAKDSKLSDNAEDLKHLREIGQKLAAVANAREIQATYGAAKVTPFEYTFNIVEDEDVNAFSVAGGYIYVNRGLLKFVQSDQELAGVLAHEVIHAAHHHMVFLAKKQAAMANVGAVALIATMLGGARSTDFGNVMQGIEWVQTAIRNGYGMQAEKDSDYGAVVLMKDSGYNPVGLLTFLERLARRIETVEYGIFRSHPVDRDRVKATKDIITQFKLPINRRMTTNGVKAVVKEDTVAGAIMPSVYIQDKLLYRPAPLGDKTSAQRAQDAAARINKALDANVQMYEVTVDPLVGGVMARGEALVTVSDADVKLMDKTAADIAKGVWSAVRGVIWKQMADQLN